MENEHEIEFLRGGKKCITTNNGYNCSDSCPNLIDDLRHSTNSKKRFHEVCRFECDLEEFPDNRLMNECGSPVTNYKCYELTKSKIKENQTI